MFLERRKVGDTRRFFVVGASGFAVYFLLGMTPAWGQQEVKAPVVQTLASSNTSLNTSTTDSSKADITDYTVSPEDLLDIEIMDVPEVSRTYRVSSNGFLTLPLLTEPVPAAGQTLDQLSKLIATRFHDAGMLNNAQVSVSLKETRLHTVLVSGEIKSPQAYPIYGPTRLLDVLVKAGGLTPSSGDDAIITRGETGAHADLAESAHTGGVDRSANGQSFTLNIRKLVATGDDAVNNIDIFPGDRIMIQRAELIYVLGAVARPGGYVLDNTRQQVTVLKALAMAGDVSNIAKRGRIVILRKASDTQDEKRQEIPVDYKAIIKGKVTDVRLQADDILFIPESGGLKALHASTQAAVAVASTGGSALLIYR
jgi:polysaccharide biosynthesis/export protein